MPLIALTIWILNPKTLNPADPPPRLAERQGSYIRKNKNILA
jgi:hypothetical protein